MGSIVQVWEDPEDSPRPASLEDALAHAGRACEQAGPRSERLGALRAALLDRYPLAPPDAPRASVWLGGALDLAAEGPGLEIAIAPARADEVRPFVVAQAV